MTNWTFLQDEQLVHSYQSYSNIRHISMVQLYWINNNEGKKIKLVALIQLMRQHISTHFQTFWTLLARYYQNWLHHTPRDFQILFATTRVHVFITNDEVYFQRFSQAQLSLEIR